jgi:hypothetical protein
VSLDGFQDSDRRVMTTATAADWTEKRQNGKTPLTQKNSIDNNGKNLAGENRETTGRRKSALFNLSSLVTFQPLTWSP